MIEIYTSTTLRVVSGDGVKIEPDAEQAVSAVPGCCARFPIRD